MDFSHQRILRLDTGVDPPTLLYSRGRTYLQITTDGVIDPSSPLGREVRQAAIYDWLLVLRRRKESEIRFGAWERTEA
jgi:hypothetical protein